MNNNYSNTPDFTVYKGTDNENPSKNVLMGVFHRNQAEEDELDILQHNLDSGMIEPNEALSHAKELSKKFPNNIEIQNFTANLLKFSFGMEDAAFKIWERLYKVNYGLIPKGFKGQISWYDLGNRPFLRIAYAYLICLIALKEAKTAKNIGNKLLKWCPSDNLGVRFVMGDVYMSLGDYPAALDLYLKEASFHPPLWYKAGQLAFRQGDFVTSCTYMRKGIASNPYIAEGITGRIELEEHRYFHGSNAHGPSFAEDYLILDPTCCWPQEEVDFLDWLFNSSHVLKERAEIMTLHENLTYEYDPSKRRSSVDKLFNFENQINDELSKQLVRKVKNRFNQDIWPWQWSSKMLDVIKVDRPIH